MNIEDKFLLPPAQFDAVRWVVFLDEQRSAFKSLCNLLADESALKVHWQTLGKKIEKLAERGEILKSILDQVKKSDDPDVFIKVRFANIGKARSIFFRQLVVVMSAIIESVVRDYFYCIFVTHPIRMYEYLSLGRSDNPKGKIDLKDVIDAPSKRGLILRLAHVSARRASSGTFEKQINRVQALSKYDFDKNVIQSVVNIVGNRNRIVHELEEIDFTEKEILDMFEEIENFILQVRDALIRDGADVHWFEDDE